MTNEPRFKAAYPYQKDVLALPVTDLDSAAVWYAAHFGMTEVERTDQPVPTVILERDGIRIGFSVNGGDASQDGAAIRVANVRSLREEVDEHDGKKLQVFFVTAPDGLCYYFHEPL